MSNECPTCGSVMGCWDIERAGMGTGITDFHNKLDTDRIADLEREIERLREAIELETDHIAMMLDNDTELSDDTIKRLVNVRRTFSAALKEKEK